MRGTRYLTDWIDSVIFSRVSFPLEVRIGDQVIRSCMDRKATLIFDSRRTLLNVLLDPEMAFGESFVSGKVQVKGDMIALLVELYRNKSRRLNAIQIGRKTLSRFSAAAKSAKLRESDLDAHYSTDAKFFGLWLDPTMTYTCAYFEAACNTLEQAQLAKMNHVARKLMLRPGQRVVEFGGGWGALAIHMAKEFGVQVQSYNLCREQVKYARAAARRCGLNEQIEFIHDDFREARGRFDAIVSVGMLEHVGRRALESVSGIIRSCLAPNGLGLIHTIARGTNEEPNPWITRHIFPGAHPLSFQDLYQPELFTKQ